ncbi:hypothetical protein ACULX3_001741 [Cronobacter turicensis]
MSEISKVIASEIADFFAGFGGPGEPDVQSGEAQRLLTERVLSVLAQRERAEPVGYRKLFTCSSCGAEGLDEPLESRCHCNGDGARWIEGRLYTAPYLAAPPAPVVADDAQPERGFRYNKDEPYGVKCSSPATVVAYDRESFEKFYGSGTTPGLDRVPPWFQEMIKDAFWEVWKGSRAALQQQPVSAPYKLPGKEE